MSVISIHKNNFEAEVLQSNRPVLLDFYADWCGPCRMVGPIVEEIAEENPQYKVCKVNVDQEPDLAQRYSVMSIPSLFVLKDGLVTAQAVGAKTKQQLLDMLK